MNPGTLFDAQALSENELDKRMRYSALFQHPIFSNNPISPAAKVGLKIGFDAASNHSMTFFELQYPAWVMQHYTLLYHACPSNTTLEKLSNQKDGSITKGGS